MSATCAATLDLGIDHLHDRGRWKNNRAENSHRPTRRRERQMQRFKSAGSAQKFLSTHAAVGQTRSIGLTAGSKPPTTAPTSPSNGSSTSWQRLDLVIASPTNVGLVLSIIGRARI
jgi:DDE domain